MVSPRKYGGKWYDKKLHVKAYVFDRMMNLRLLDVVEKFTYSKPTVLPNKLKWFCWEDYPFTSLPVSQMSKLAGLKMENGKIQRLWNGQKVMQNLKYINLTSSKFLTRFPDVSRAPNIEKLILSCCRGLVEVHESLGFLKRLVDLNMSCCSRLKRLPSMIEMESLENLDLSCCSGLERFPEVSPCMVKLSHISLIDCAKIKELPSSIRYLSSLSFLYLTNCKSLKTIPNTICELKCLKSLCLFDCKKLQKLPEELGTLENLEDLQLGFSRPIKRKAFLRNLCSLRNFQSPIKGVAKSFPENFHALTYLCSLRILDLSERQLRDEDFPNHLCGFSSLEELVLSGNLKLIQLPSGISHLSRLKRLILDDCSNLQKLHALPSGIQVLEASNCSSLEKIDDLSKKHERLNKLLIYGCQKLLEDEESERYLDKMLQRSFLKKCAALDHCLSIAIPGSKIPSWVKEQHDEGEIAVKLTPQWETEIMGFVVCGVFGQSGYFGGPRIEFSSEYGETGITWPDYSTPVDGNENVFIGYVPFSLFQQHIDDDDDCKYWSPIIQGNFRVKLLLNRNSKCGRGVYVVYKKDVESDQQMEPSISSYWNWKPTAYSWRYRGETAISIQ